MRRPAIRKPCVLFSALVVCLLLTILVGVGSVWAQGSSGDVTDDEVNAIAKELYCPVCESTPLDVCATQACADWREVIRTKLAEGQTEEEIKAYFELQYGPRALAEPPRRGFTSVLWILPVVAVAVGGLFFGWYVWNMRTSPATPEPLTMQDEARGQVSSPQAKEPESEDYRARVERELREM